MTFMFQVDAFSDGPFTGNPAAVVLLDEEPPAAAMQNLAMENQLSETAYVWPADEGFYLRWFTPNAEVALCGHATLATAHVLYSRGMQGELRFYTKSGWLNVTQDNDRLMMDFPARVSEVAEAPEGLLEALGVVPQSILRNVDDYIAVLASQAEVEAVAPNMGLLAKVAARGVVVTAAADTNSAGIDFVSRFFAPQSGVPEDPVTGSAHCALAPYWAHRLEQSRLTGRQLSARGGTVGVEVRGDRVILSGQAVTVFSAQLQPAITAQFRP